MTMLLLQTLLAGYTPSCDKTIDMEYYSICYDFNLKSPTMVKYTLTRDMIKGKGIKKRLSFRISPGIPREYAASNDDYKGSEYDRGHLASDASFDKNLTMLRSTYYYANTVPMHRRVNRYYWSKVERYERIIAAKLKTINVTNIIIFDDPPPRIGKGQIAVPKGFYKIIASEDATFMRCFYYKNSNIEIENKLQNHIIECSEIKE